MSIKSTIESLDFFSTLKTQDVELLTSISTLQSYNSEYVLYYEKEESNNLLFLVSGLAKTYKIDKHSNEIFLYYIYKESLISEITNIKNETLTSFSNVALVEDSQILSIDYKEFKKHFLEKNLLCLELVNEISLRSKKIESLINREFIFDSVEKVAMMLYSDLDMFNKLKRHDISLILHIQPATLSRVLNRLKRNKIIDIMQGKVTILDTIALREIGND
ncbi:putative transcriptional regulator, Crp/Fnr family [Sulfurimonas gotlandica GD1]|uniref:Putative transcriptional regulator, Crp/Fnr family n=1 Tax=Sulfurimonas gotlandica (strain DSM 19862 / JCM 16533 / GD1) TaxID=929558 RepID=B6BML5_SULGG|nr:Crp/Fnr family transcriptional regulator [Sulfurimonas gotlandica]EDZ61641.1 cyclic nucleotide-binding domain protein [Sulfurimonas gotlandica GD1]EHP30869.1 putative transcriptional regulator, Crp/Fnr family [Sulfurimonas gotlandica GD1]